MKHLKNLCIVTGTYEKGGETKKRWLTIGSLMENDKGQFILLDPMVNLAAVQREHGKDRVIVSLFDPLTGEAKVKPLDDSIPF
jgi:hypothetical protein